MRCKLAAALSSVARHVQTGAAAAQQEDALNENSSRPFVALNRATSDNNSMDAHVHQVVRAKWCQE